MGCHRGAVLPVCEDKRDWVLPDLGCACDVTTQGGVATTHTHTHTHTGGPSSLRVSRAYIGLASNRKAFVMKEFSVFGTDFRKQIYIFETLPYHITT